MSHILTDLPQDSAIPTESTDTASNKEMDEAQEIVDALRAFGRDELAARIAQLQELLAADPDAPDLILESLQSFASFFTHEDRLPVPEVGAGPEGFLEAEWQIPANGGSMPAPDGRHWGSGDGILAIKFLSAGLVQFAATSGPAGQGKERLRAGGILPKKDIMSAVQPFVFRLTIP